MKSTTYDRNCRRPEPRFKRYGLLTLKWVLIAGFGFFAVLILERVA